ncbi:MAG: DNA repair protein RadA [Oscillospiraceae bacterium]|nr:DNA repair protein RadA [Oscillospiraceae bacterium]
MKQKTVFCCTECGNETLKWSGRCPVCGAWDSFKEVKLEKSGGKTAAVRSAKVPKLISELDNEEELRFSTGIGELDRVLGGGAVKGSIVLVGGAPGIGKSTLLLQLCGLVDEGQKILYVSGEESERQIKMRAQRLGVDGGKIYVLAETGLNEVLSAAERLEPDLVIIDSIQTMFDADVSSAPGSISQVRECTMAIMRQTKDSGYTTFVVGHINKEGSIAGPKVLEHMVDCVLYFEGERSTSFRILRAGKNRFGSTNEIGVFEMADNGLKELQNPSEILLSGRPDAAPGTCVTCVIEGSRPILAEIQALVAPSAYNSGRRSSNGIDYNRATLLLAVLEKRGGMALSGCDAYINVIGGLELDEPSADLATVLAIASSFRDKPLGADLAAVGEVGLSGEVRSINSLNMRLTEISRLGFKRCVIPAHIKDDIKAPQGLELIAVKDIREAIRQTLG